MLIFFHLGTVNLAKRRIIILLNLVRVGNQISHEVWTRSVNCDTSFFECQKMKTVVKSFVEFLSTFLYDKFPKYLCRKL